MCKEPSVSVLFYNSSLPLARSVTKAFNQLGYSEIELESVYGEKLISSFKTTPQVVMFHLDGMNGMKYDFLRIIKKEINQLKEAGDNIKLVLLPTKELEYGWKKSLSSIGPDLTMYVQPKNKKIKASSLQRRMHKEFQRIFS